MRRDPELVPLSRHHHHGLVAAERVRRGIRRGLDAELARRLADDVRAFHATDLEPHFAAEESWLLPAIRDRAPDLVARTLSDHARLRAAVRFDSSDVAAALGAWAELLVQHIRFEERELFETAHQVIPRDEMATIGERLATLSREPHLPGDPL